MKIKVTSVYVDDQSKALRYYTEVLGFAKKTDFSQGPYRWLTVASPEEPNGTELQLALNNNPAAKAYQQAMLQQGQPAAMFFTDDVKGDYERIKAPASAARGRFRGGHGGRTAPSLPAEARTISGGGCLAGAVPPVLVRSRGCAGTAPRPHGTFITNKKQDRENTTRLKPRT